MRAYQHIWTEASGWLWDPAYEPAGLGPPHGDADPARVLLLAFGDSKLLSGSPALAHLRTRYPGVSVLAASAGGVIRGDRVLDGAVVVAHLVFEHTTVAGAMVPLGPGDRGESAGRAVASALPAKSLRHVLVFAEGIDINGSDLVRGLLSGLPPEVSVSGGLAADVPDGETLVSFDAEPKRGQVAAVGLYGTQLRVGCASLGGWDSFGPDRLVTRSTGNVVYELDGEPALALYQRYLGPHAGALPSSAMRFPLSLLRPSGDYVSTSDTGVVRTVSSVRQEDAAMVFAGDVPEGSHVRFMKANLDRLVDGAALAAEVSRTELSPTFALLVSCVGRRTVLRQRIEEEVEAVRDVLGAGVSIAGFYSSGEIAPFEAHARCELHNQTMTVTTLAEIP